MLHNGASPLGNNESQTQAHQASEEKGFVYLQVNREGFKLWLV